MSYSKFVKALASVTILGAVGLLAGCNQGDTDGGSANDNILGPGSQPVSDGGFGASLTIRLENGGDTMEVAQRTRFFVTALDPSGIPLGFRRVFCDSELGIAILEPSANGVAFEHTNSAGEMSGILGGVTPGSFLLECRLEEGFNLVARKTIRIHGEVPEGFQGFPGAAGGNIGGGSIQPNPNATAQLVQIVFNGVGLNNDANGPIDITQNLDCNADGGATADDLEPFSFDEYTITVNNRTTGPLAIDSVTFTVNDGRNVVSTQQFAGMIIPAGSSQELSGTFIEFVLGSNTKVFAGTAFNVLLGTYNVTFTVNATAANGDDVELEGSASVTFGEVDNC